MAATRWEYLQVTTPSAVFDADRLDALGDDGWELVSITPTATLTAYIFKRPRKAPR